MPKEHLDLDGLFRSQFGIYRAHFWQIFRTTVLVMLLPALVWLVSAGPSKTLDSLGTFTIGQALDTFEKTSDDDADQSAENDTVATPSGSDQTGDSGASGATDFDGAFADVIASLSAFHWITQLETLVVVAVFYFYLAAMAVFVFELKSGKAAALPAHIGTTLLRAIPAFLANLICVWLIILGLFLFVVPGLWLYGVFAVIVPVVAVEGLYFTSFGRSAFLTKGYRWPSFLYLIAVVLLVLALVFGWSLIFTGLHSLVAPLGTSMSAAISLPIAFIVHAIILPIGTLAAPVLYVRLRELKEA